jgi:hypothetical protein
MLSVVTVLAMFSIRSFKEVGWTVLGLLAMTATLWWLRRVLRRSFAPAAPQEPSLVGVDSAEKH